MFTSVSGIYITRSPSKGKTKKCCYYPPSKKKNPAGITGREKNAGPYFVLDMYNP